MDHDDRQVRDKNGEPVIQKARNLSLDYCSNPREMNKPQLKNFMPPDQLATGKNVICIKNKGNLTENKHIAFETCNQKTYAKKCEK